MNKLSNKTRKNGVLLAVIASLSIIILVGAAAIYVSVIEGMLEEDTTAFIDGFSSLGANYVAQKVDRDFFALDELAAAVSLNESITGENSLKLLKDVATLDKSYRMAIIDTDGAGVTSDGENVSYIGTGVFENVMRGERTMSDPIPSRVETDVDVLVAAVPILRNGEIVGGVASVQPASGFINEINLDQVMLGYSCIVKPDGQVISSQNGGENAPIKFSELLDKSHGGDSLGGLMESGQNGSFKFKANSGEYFISYKSIGINDWYLVSMVPREAVAKRAAEVFGLTLMVSCVLVLVFVAFLVYMFKTRRIRQKEMERLVFYDALTGLPNSKELERAYEKLKESAKDYSYIAFDIMGFGKLNEIFGVEAGNDMLKNVAKILAQSAGEGERAFRIRADKFSMFLKKTKDKEMEWRIKRIFDKLVEIRITDGEAAYAYECAFACGVYGITGEEDSLETIRDRADIALKQGKSQQRKSHIGFFDDTLMERLKNKNELLAGVDKAFVSREFVPYFQPAYDLKSGRVMGAETLARWDRPDRGVIAPAEFIPVLEQSGLILELDMYMLEEACKLVRKWTDSEIMPVPISVNMSRLNIHKKEFIDRIVEITDKYKVPPVLIELELSETALFENSDRLAGIMKSLHEYGFLLAMDNFGSGYTSATMLGKLPIDILKLDRKLLNGADESAKQGLVMANIVNMAKDLDIKVIAEGIEQEAQADFLKEIGCDIGQGYLFSKPLPLDEFEKLMI